MASNKTRTRFNIVVDSNERATEILKFLMPCGLPPNRPREGWPGGSFPFGTDIEVTVEDTPGHTIEPYQPLINAMLKIGSASASPLEGGGVRIVVSQGPEGISLYWDFKSKEEFIENVNKLVENVKGI